MNKMNTKERTLNFKKVIYKLYYICIEISDFQALNLSFALKNGCAQEKGVLDKVLALFSLGQPVTVDYSDSLILRCLSYS